jgi:hypothetical protein
MKTSALDKDIRARVEGFLEELSQLVKQSTLHSVMAALGHSQAGPARRAPGRPRKMVGHAPVATAATRAGLLAKAGAKGKRGRRPSADIEKAGSTILALIRSKPGLRLEEIGKQLRVPTKGLKLPIAKLLKAKAVSTKGQKRGTRYFPKGK